MAASVGKRGIMSVLDSARASLSPGGHIKASDSDTWILGVMITSLLVMGPLQPVLFDSLIHGEIATPETAPEEWLSEDRMILVLWLSEDRMILVFRVLQGVGLLGGLLGLRRHPRYRAAIVLADFVFVWLLTLPINLRFLAATQGMRDPKLMHATIACQVSLALCFHVALPIRTDRLAVDLVCYLIVVVMHGLGGLLVVPFAEARLFWYVLFVTSLVPILLR